MSSRVEYALAALLELASHADQGEPLRVKHIADRQGIPDRYLEHIFNALGRAGIVRGQRGVKGGYLLARNPQQITLLEVFECLEDGRAVKQAQSALSINRSIVREAWKQAHLSAQKVLQQLTLQDLYQQRQQQEQVGNVMYYI